MNDHPTRSTGPWPRRLTAGAVVPLLCGLLACGSAGAPGQRASAILSENCTSAAIATTGSIAAHLYGEVAGGRIVTEAIDRLRHSSSLIAAVEQGDRRAAQRILSSLVEAQIIRARVLRGGRVLASVGAREALAPSTLALLNGAGQKVGSVVVSTQVTSIFMNTLANVTASQVVIFHGEDQLMSNVPGARFSAAAIPDRGPATIGGHSFVADSLFATGFPDERLRIVVLMPPGALACEGSAAQTAAAVIGRVAMRIYRGEQSGSGVAHVIAQMEHTPAFVQAVAKRDPIATRDAIIGFFRNRTHVVRVRVTIGGKLFLDVGGPHVLAPLAGTLRVGGRVVGHFLTAIQDDAGYLKLVHGFTGAQVLMRVGSEQVESTLGPQSARLALPDRGTVRYRGVTYEVYTLLARAFPSGQLRIGLLIPVR